MTDKPVQNLIVTELLDALPTIHALICSGPWSRVATRQLAKGYALLQTVRLHCW
jgi:hypothetical protein